MEGGVGGSGGRRGIWAVGLRPLKAVQARSIHIYIYIYIHIYIYTYFIHIYIYMYTYMCIHN